MAVLALTTFVLLSGTAVPPLTTDCNSAFDTSRTSVSGAALRALCVQHEGCVGSRLQQLCEAAEKVNHKLNTANHAERERGSRIQRSLGIGANEPTLAQLASMPAGGTAGGWYAANSAHYAGINYTLTQLASMPNSAAWAVSNTDWYNANPKCHPMADWTQARVEAFVVDMATTHLGMVGSRAANFSARFAAHHVDGFALAHLTSPQLTAMGVAVGYHARILAHVAQNTLNFATHLPPGRDPCSRYAALHRGATPMFVDFFMMRLLGVNEESYEFSLTYWTIETWKEDRHLFLPVASHEELAACVTRVLDPVAGLSFKCADPLWGKTPDTKGGRSRVEQSAADHETLTDFPVEYYGNGMAGVAGFTNGASHSMLAKGTFTTDMSFDSFPFDRQRLILRNLYYEPGLLMQPSSVGYFPVPPEFEPAPGWTIVGMTQNLTTMRFDLRNLSANHLYNFEQVPGADFTGVQASIAYSLEVRRVSSFYTWNLVLPVVLLNILSWSSFVLQPQTIDVRLATTMTILIALVAFQFIVNDALPKTGSLTKMHIFLIMSNVMIVLGGLESLFVYYLVEQDLSTVSQCLERIAWQFRFRHRVRPSAQTVHVQAASEGGENDAATPAGGSETKVQRGDGVVTGKELENIHRIDQACFVMFPLLYTVFTAVVLSDDGGYG